MREVFHGDSEGSGQAEVGQLQDAFTVDQQVLGLKITVEDFVLVTLSSSVQQLVQKALLRDVRIGWEGKLKRKGNGVPLFRDLLGLRGNCLRVF